MKIQHAPFEQLWRTMTKPFVVFGMFVLFAILYIWCDQALAFALSPLRGMTSLKILTLMGLGALWISTLGFLFVLFYVVLKKRDIALKLGFLWLCVFIPNMIHGVLKVTLGRARPLMLLDKGEYGFYGFKLDSAFWSFPSGHTTTVVALALGAWFFWPRYRLWYVLFALLLPITRLMLAKHYLSDVMMTAYLTLIEVGLIYMLWNRLQVKYSCRN